METEVFYSGYCRMLDGSRTVTAVAEDGKLTEVDCCFESCVHTQVCQIAQQLHRLSED